jgi:hypothetical protein
MELTFIQQDSAPTGVQTLFQIMPNANIQMVLEAIVIIPLGNTGATKPCQFDLSLQDTAGTATDRTWSKRYPQAAETAQGGLRTSFTVEPATSTAHYAFGTHQQAPIEWRPPEANNELLMQGGQRWGLRYVAEFVAVQWQVFVRE